MRLKEIVFDARDPATLARFWAAAIEEYDVRPYDGAEIARLAAIGLTPETDPNVMVDGPGPTLCFQWWDPLSETRSRVHLDFRGDEDDIARLQELGARVKERRDGYVIMLDPENNAFCVQLQELESRL